ncbi:MAG: FtsX-like permease family protein [bacterium]|nr:FtsX-like permease family protein [bacterium]
MFKENKRKSGKPPWLAKWLFSRMSRYQEMYSITCEVDEVFHSILSQKGYLRAALWYWYQAAVSYFRYTSLSFYRSTAMFRNYLKTAFRNIIKHKGYSLINIFGLAAGIGCCILILLYVQFEMSYDDYHEDAGRIFRIAGESNSKYGTNKLPSVPAALMPVIVENCPQIEFAARLNRRNRSLIRYEDKLFYEERCWFTEEAFFDIFSVRFLAGDRSTALETPNSVVISYSMAKKYFGSDDPVGKTITVDGRDFNITGVVEDTPQNSHLKYHFLASLKSRENEDFITNWQSSSCYTYVKLLENSDSHAFEAQINNIIPNYISSDQVDNDFTRTFFLQPLTDIYLFSNLFSEIKPAGNPVYLYIFSIIGIFILITAWINFVNLSIARSAERAREVGMRKVVGANRMQLIRQFLGDSLLISLFAITASLIIVGAALRYFNDLTALNLSVYELFDPIIVLSLLILIIVTGFCAGSFPALFLSGFDPVKVLKGNLTTRFRKTILHTTLIVSQFSISIILIICTLVVYSQLSFMKDKYLGFEKEQVLIIPTIYSEGRSITNGKFNLIRDEFLKYPSISGVAFSSNIPGRVDTGVFLGGAWEIDGSRVRYEVLFVDYDFNKVYDIKMAAGRTFLREFSADTANGVLINETASKAMGFSSPDEAVGKEMVGSRSGRIILGVTEDFHLDGLQTEITPLVMRPHNNYMGVINLKINTENLSEAISTIERGWKELYPGKPFNFFFLDASFDRQYKSEEKLGKIIGIFTFLGLFIACIGLFGFASFIAERRTKEVAIRKVLGSKVTDIVLLQSKEFIRWVLAANLIAWPAAYFSTEKWLQNFAYKIDIGIEIFIIAGSCSLLIALSMVSYQIIKASIKNPVDSLMQE